ncbi:hypothetical protein [Actinoplanes palleronii]|uniref:Uncharacterized protein n=1 Tax=Actinoplanes palleronii TaxID=113570 RepID=A0ABQ4BTL8_9ACTN|nr:hypothetical protein [Actinoplanes palleronii]GIE74017.1 hypothetical protein Apa02nite_101250 [Actinoplanes palleronii]
MQIQNAINATSTRGGGNIEPALRELSDAVETSGSPEARDSFDTLTEELANLN